MGTNERLQYRKSQMLIHLGQTIVTSEKNLKQVWFPGVHANVGGGNPDTELSDITLAWMMSQLDKWIDFDDDYIMDQLASNQKYRLERKASWVQWAKGLITDSADGLVSVLGKKRRTPGRYTKVEYDTGLSTGKPLENTNECIHASVRARMKYEGHSYDHEGSYDPFAAPAKVPAPLQDLAYPGGALLEWRLRDGNQYADQPPQGLYYEYVGTDKNVKPQQLCEDELGKYEKMLLEQSSAFAEQILASNAAALRLSIAAPPTTLL